MTDDRDLEIALQVLRVLLDRAPSEEAHAWIEFEMHELLDEVAARRAAEDDEADAFAALMDDWDDLDDEEPAALIEGRIRGVSRRVASSPRLSSRP